MASKSLADRLNSHQYPKWYFSHPWVLKIVYAWFAVIYQRVGLSLSGIKLILASLPKDAKVLDAGFGEGQFLYSLAKRNPSIEFLGYDYNSNTLELGNFLIRKKKLNNVKLNQVNLSNPWPLENNSLDAIWCIGVMHCIPDDENMLLQVARCLKPGAPFLVYSPLKSRIVLSIYNYLLNKYPGYDRLQRAHDYSFDEIKSKARLAGLEIRKARFTHGLPGIISYEWFTLLITLITHAGILLKIIAFFVFPFSFPFIILLRWIDQLFPPKTTGNGLLIEFVKAC